MSAPCFFSIATGSHVTLSVALFESVLAHSDKALCEPEQFLFLLGCDGSLPSTTMADVHVVHVESILDPVLIARLADLYTPAEYCWALKPFLFRYLLDQFDAVFYFDSDIWFTGSCDDLVAELGDSPILLTPHYLEPFGCASDYGVRSLSLLRGGVFNVGFIGLSRSDQAGQFLHWWSDHVSRHGRNDPDNGMCGDQRWLDLVPALFPGLKISRHPGLNVGYWNIHQRAITQIDGSYLVNGEPLLFLHLSGFNKNNPLAFSSHLPQFTADGALAGLLREYAETIDAAQLRLVDFHPVYAYRRWWHRFVKPYRWLLDLFKNPRSCR